MSWEIYYKQFKDKPESELLKIAMDIHGKNTGLAYDLGAGTGADTAFFLKNKWKVISVDKEESAINILNQRFGAKKTFSSCLANFSNLNLQRCDHIHGTYSYPFAGEEGFQGLWRSINQSLRVGGILSGELFGEQDGWHRTHRVKTLAHNEMIDLIKSFHVHYFDELFFEKETALGHMKNWHVYQLILEKTS